MPHPTIHLVRHAQGYHNLRIANHQMPDPLLTSLGESQCRSLCAAFPFPPTTSSTNLHILAKPHKPTIYTALLAFAPWIIMRNLTVLALPEIQETSDLPCDTGSRLDELKREFHGKPVDLSLVEKAGDSWCVKSGRWSPSTDAIEKRARDAREWLWGREEEVVVVVTHGGFLHYFTEDWSGHNKIQGTGWENTEYRTYRFASRTPTPSYSLVEVPASSRRRSGMEKPLSEAEKRNLERSAQVQREQEGNRKDKDDSKKGLFSHSKPRTSAAGRGWYKVVDRDALLFEETSWALKTIRFGGEARQYASREAYRSWTPRA